MTWIDVERDPELAVVRSGDELDWDALQRYLRAVVEEDLSPTMEVGQFPNGSANLTYLIAFAERRFVIRRPPRGTLPPGAHDMAREHRVLSRLWRSYPRAPRALAFSDDSGIIGAPFLVIEYRPGSVIRSGLPAAMDRHSDAPGAVSAAFVDAVADLHMVRPEDCGLQDLGRPDGFVERQLRGWAKRWGAARRPDRPVPAMDRIGEALGSGIPTPQQVSFVHSDLKLDNCQFASDDPTVVRSVFDWDMTTLGDPLIDLGTALSYWPALGSAGAAARALWPGQDRLGLWSREKVRERYAALTGLDVSRSAWYEAFGSWKTAIALQQLANRGLDGHTQDSRLAGYAEIVPVAAEAAWATLQESS